eukprot:9346417-Pyramimonas_sp.AAC.2
MATHRPPLGSAAGALAFFEQVNPFFDQVEVNEPFPTRSLYALLSNCRARHGHMVSVKNIRIGGRIELSLELARWLNKVLTVNSTV